MADYEADYHDPIPSNNSQSTENWINVPQNCNSLFWAVSLAYLIPVKRSDDEFKNRFAKLFGDEELENLPKVKCIIQKYKPRLASGDIFKKNNKDKSLTLIYKLVSKFCDRLYEYIERNQEEKFGYTVVDFEHRKKKLNCASILEVQAVSFMLDSNVSVRTLTFESNVRQEVFPQDNSHSGTIELFCLEERAKNNINYYYHFEINSMDLVNPPSNSQSRMLSHFRLPPKKELIRKLLDGKKIAKCKHCLEKLLEELPGAHVTPFYDEFLIFSFLGSAVTLPRDIMRRVGIENIYFNLSIQSGGTSKFIRLIFKINDSTKKTKKLVLRTVIVSAVKKGESLANLPTCLYSPSEVQDILTTSIGQNVDYEKTDAKILHIKLIKLEESEERSVEITDDNLKEALKREAGTLSSLPGDDYPAPTCFKAISSAPSLDTEFENALEKLSQEIDIVQEGVATIFEILIIKLRKYYTHFPKGKSDVNYRESRFHGFVYGTFILNFMSLYHINCYAERRSGAGGGPDLIFISRKDEYLNRNLNAVPVIVELKVDKDAETDARLQVMRNIYPSLRTFSKEAVVASVSLFSIKQGLRSKLSPLEVEKAVISSPGNFILLLLDKIDDPNWFRDVQEELKCLYHSIPSIHRIDSHVNYLSRLILGEVLATSTASTGLEKFVFIYEDKGLSGKVTTFLLQKGDQNVVLNITESDTIERRTFNLENAIFSTSNEVNIENNSDVHRVDIKVNPVDTDFSKRIQDKLYLTDIQVKTCKSKSEKREGNFKIILEDPNVNGISKEYRGKFIAIGNLDYITPEKGGKLKIVEKETLILNSCEVLDPIRELIAVQENEVKTQINFQAVLQGLFMGKQNIAQESKEVIKVLSETDVGLNQVANLVISIADEDKKIREENEAIVILRKMGRSNDVKEFALRTLIDKRIVPSHTFSFNNKADAKEDLVRIDVEIIRIRHPSYSENTIVLIFEYICDGNESEVSALLNGSCSIKQYMFRLIEQDEWDKVKVLIDKDVVDADTQDRKGMSILHHAVRYDEEDMVKFLISKKVYINVEDEKGNTPLHYACRNGDPNIVSLLIENGADNNFNDKLKGPLYYLNYTHGSQIITLFEKKFRQNFWELYRISEDRSSDGSSDEASEFDSVDWSSLSLTPCTLSESDTEPPSLPLDESDTESPSTLDDM